MATKHVAVRLDEDILGKVDALIPRFSKPWRPAKRSDVLRALILAGLDANDRGEIDIERLPVEDTEEAPPAKTSRAPARKTTRPKR